MKKILWTLYLLAFITATLPIEAAPRDKQANTAAHKKIQRKKQRKSRGLITGTVPRPRR